VRIALGATSGNVMWTVFRDAGAMVATGAVVGVVLAGLSGHLISTFLFGVDPLDPLTFLTVPGLILCTALVAAAAPAWRASRVDPVVAFRQEH
jgi:ABC-type antimicrobial peptide transport system permease subunit